MEDMYKYKIVERYKYNTITFYDVSLIGKASLFLGDEVPVEYLEKLYMIEHPAVSRVKVVKKKKISTDEEDNGPIGSM